MGAAFFQQFFIHSALPIAYHKFSTSDESFTFIVGEEFWYFREAVEAEIGLLVAAGKIFGAA